MGDREVYLFKINGLWESMMTSSECCRMLQPGR
jgi:hypothetical protein